jgi:hypothetical protein
LAEDQAERLQQREESGAADEEKADEDYEEVERTPGDEDTATREGRHME